MGRLRSSGWRPTPLREFVLKVHQRCNLACDYCYVYELADQSWRDRPRVITPALWRAAARRIGEHAAQHGLDRVHVVLHGGEPLLAGTRRLISLIGDLRAAMPSGCRLTVGMQTNGVLLDDAMLDALAGADVRIGVSVDGVEEDHDRHRRFRDGGGSYRAVEKALRLLGARKGVFAGLLCTVNPAADAVTTYESLLAYAPPEIDFLLPHTNWANPPATGRAHGAWLTEVFDRWYAAPRQETRIRLFEDVMSLVLGGHGRSEQAGLSPVAVAVIETDGSIEQVDSLKSAYPGAAGTGLNVLTDSFDAALRHPGIVARQIGVEALAETCQQCPIHRVCGGGHYAHRFRPGEGFRNPTVYCEDMRLLIGHISRRLAADLAPLVTL
ncbi:FxsB family cyclophane-forming radical SAM/SPASM peptide maturase [Winogradskya consettensis]|uniref:FxsB family cyclophane-forming radical SAM/SPASM peptide maturase n=1 Tax=Winogradskya consettensis TaxID=113560 RepID=UPI001FD2A8E5|nr:FxsB family cyclophane-forming radical SAM/SPASM peptide maturase [Actinoplanes consettensis]